MSLQEALDVVPVHGLLRGRTRTRGSRATGAAANRTAPGRGCERGGQHLAGEPTRSCSCPGQHDRHPCTEAAVARRVRERSSWPRSGAAAVPTCQTPDMPDHGDRTRILFLNQGQGVSRSPLGNVRAQQVYQAHFPPGATVDARFRMMGPFDLAQRAAVTPVPGLPGRGYSDLRWFALRSLAARRIIREEIRSWHPTVAHVVVNGAALFLSSIQTELPCVPAFDVGDVRVDATDAPAAAGGAARSSVAGPRGPGAPLAADRSTRHRLDRARARHVRALVPRPGSRRCTRGWTRTCSRPGSGPDVPERCASSSSVDAFSAKGGPALLAAAEGLRRPVEVHVGDDRAGEASPVDDPPPGAAGNVGPGRPVQGRRPLLPADRVGCGAVGRPWRPRPAGSRSSRRRWGRSRSSSLPTAEGSCLLTAPKPSVRRWPTSSRTTGRWQPSGGVRVHASRRSTTPTRTPHAWSSCSAASRGDGARQAVAVRRCASLTAKTSAAHTVTVPTRSRGQFRALATRRLARARTPSPRPGGAAGGPDVPPHRHWSRWTPGGLPCHRPGSTNRSSG